MAQSPKSLYEILGLEKSATTDQIRDAYRKLAKRYHPDLNPGNKEAEHRFKEISAANEILSDPEKRTQYDRGEINEEGQPRPSASSQPGSSQTGRAGPFYYESQDQGGRYSQTFSNGFGGLDDDILNSIFGAAARQGRSRGGPSASPRGEDRNYQMEVDFKDSVIGAEREITLPDGRRLAVKIPPGITSGTRLRFKGYGTPGGAGISPPGDAYVEVLVRPSTQFRRVGQNIEAEIPISFIDAILGGEIRVPTVDGNVMLKIPPHSNTGTRLRIRGKGVPDRTGKNRGDEIAILKLILPDRIDPELESVIRQWKQRGEQAA